MPNIFMTTIQGGVCLAFLMVILWGAVVLLLDLRRRRLLLLLPTRPVVQPLAPAATIEAEPVVAYVPPPAEVVAQSQELQPTVAMAALDPAAMEVDYENELYDELTDLIYAEFARLGVRMTVTEECVRDEREGL